MTEKSWVVRAGRGLPLTPGECSSSHGPDQPSSPDPALGVFLLVLLVPPFSHTCLPASAGPIVTSYPLGGALSFGGWHGGDCGMGRTRHNLTGRQMWVDQSTLQSWVSPESPAGQTEDPGGSLAAWLSPQLSLQCSYPPNPEALRSSKRGLSQRSFLKCSPLETPLHFYLFIFKNCGKVYIK